MKNINFGNLYQVKNILNENILNFDERLLKNFYLNKGYYNVKINSSFAKLIDEKEVLNLFIILMQIKNIYFERFLDLPIDFKKENFEEFI